MRIDSHVTTGKVRIDWKHGEHGFFFCFVNSEKKKENKDFLLSKKRHFGNTKNNENNKYVTFQTSCVFFALRNKKQF